jgi:hypothetical protein
MPQGISAPGALQDSESLTESNFPLSQLTDELLTEVLRYLVPAPRKNEALMQKFETVLERAKLPVDLARVGRVSHRFKRLASISSLWQPLCQRYGFVSPKLSHTELPGAQALLKQRMCCRMDIRRCLGSMLRNRRPLPVAQIEAAEAQLGVRQHQRLLCQLPVAIWSYIDSGGSPQQVYLPAEAVELFRCLQEVGSRDPVRFRLPISVHAPSGQQFALLTLDDILTLHRLDPDRFAAEYGHTMEDTLLWPGLPPRKGPDGPGRRALLPLTRKVRGLFAGNGDTTDDLQYVLQVWLPSHGTSVSEELRPILGNVLLRSTIEGCCQYPSQQGSVEDFLVGFPL